MKESIKQELISYIQESSYDCEDLHNTLFNQDYYIIGYYKAQKWLESHNVTVWEALETIREYEELNFGKCRHYTNAEETVNMLVYIYGEQLLTELELI